MLQQMFATAKMIEKIREGFKMSTIWSSVCRELTNLKLFSWISMTSEVFSWITCGNTSCSQEQVKSERCEVRSNPESGKLGQTPTSDCSWSSATEWRQCPWKFFSKSWSLRPSTWSALPGLRCHWFTAAPWRAKWSNGHTGNPRVRWERSRWGRETASYKHFDFGNLVIQKQLSVALCK